ncbi:MAG: 4'-phosphopantetheinyl transferase superfamily protein [Burkholderiaceae bacterium]
MQRIPLPESLASVIEIHRVDLELEHEPREACAVLAPEERDAAQRYRFRADRVRYAVTRAAVRELLARRFGCAPQAVDIAVGPHRKPWLRGVGGGPAADAPLFNVSHSGRFSLIAIGASARLGALGVDIEHCDPALDPFPIADIGCTGPERECLRRASNPLDVLYPIWVAKEAALKAVGVGIPEHLLSVCIELGPVAQVGVGSTVAAWAGLKAMALPAPSGYVAAVAWREKECAS